MKLFTSIFLLLMFQNLSFACMCPNLRFSVSEEELEEYDFIAYVFINDIIMKNETNIDSPRRRKYILEIEILEKFKGEKTDSIIDYTRFSSCSLGYRKGEEWIVFANKDELGELFVGPCYQAIKYRKANGQRHGINSNGISSLNKLKAFYSHPHPVRVFGDEYHETFYKDGQQELKEKYINGKLDGERKVWYPNGQLMYSEYYKEGERHGDFRRFHSNGQLMYSEYYKEGKRDGDFKGFHSNGQLEYSRSYKNQKREGAFYEYYPTGQLEKEDYYLNDKRYNVSRTYYDSTYSNYSKDYLSRIYLTADSLNYAYNRIQVRREIVYDHDGNVLIIREYRRLGGIDYEVYNAPNNGIRTFIYYHKNGNVSSIAYSKENKDFGRYQEFDKNGLPSNHWNYDENGERIEDVKDDKN